MEDYDRENLLYFRRSLEEKLDEGNSYIGAILKIFGSAGGPVDEGVGIDLRLLMIHLEIKEIKQYVSRCTLIFAFIAIVISLDVFHHW